MSEDPDWQNDEKSEYDIKKLFASSLFKSKTDQDAMSWKIAKLAGLYICKHGSTSRRRYLIANLVASGASATKKMEPQDFVDAIRPILEMAAIQFTNAVFET